MAALRPRAAAGLAVVLLSTVALGGCRGSSDDEPDARPTRTTASPTVLPTVPSTGPENAPLHWELVRGAAADDPRVVAVQRFVAYDTYVTTVPEQDRDGDDARTYAEGYDEVATGTELEEVSDATLGYLRGSVATGPQWLRVDAPRGTGGNATITVCLDDNHYGAPGSDAGTAPQPASASTYTVSRVAGTWKVSLVRAAPSADRTRCAAWDLSGHRAP